MEKKERYILTLTSMCFLKKIHCLRLEKYFSRSAFLIKKSPTFQGLILLLSPKGGVTVVFLPSFLLCRRLSIFLSFPTFSRQNCSRDRRQWRYEIRSQNGTQFVLFPIRAPQQKTQRMGRERGRESTGKDRREEREERMRALSAATVALSLFLVWGIGRREG